MQNLKKWEQIIKQKRSKTDFRTFVKEIGSFIPVVLYKGEGEVSRYPKSDRIKVLPTKKYEEIRDDLVKYGLEYDFEKNFFENYEKLIKKTGGAATMKDPKAVNSEYAEAVWYSKNVYLSFIVIGNCENVCYTFYAQENVSDIFNGVMIWDNCSIVYMASAVIKSFKIFYSRYIVNSNNIWFSSNLIGCSECIFCDGLENQSYCINNKKLEKEEYFKQKEEILRKKNNFSKFYKKVNKKAINLSSKNVNGEFCVYSENVENGYYCYRLQNARNAFFVGHENGRKNVLDTICSDEASPGDIYGCANLGLAQNVYMSDAFIGTNLYYCFDVINCNYCIGCRGLKNKNYCILNKQYTKEEWYKMADKIFEQMNNDGILGDRLSPKLSPFYFNDTLAYLIDNSFTKEEITKEGFMWRDEKIRVDIPDESIVVGVEELDKYEGFDENGNWQINPEILKKVIKDKNGDYYKIVKMEYDFLVKHGLPLPRLHWLERMKVNFGV